MSDEDFCTCGHWRRDHEASGICTVESVVEGEPFYCPCSNFEIELREEPSNLWDTCTACELPLPSCKCNVDATAVNEAAMPSLSPEMAVMRPAVVTSDAGVVEGIFTSRESALIWAKQHRMDERNIRGGAPFHDVRFPLRAVAKLREEPSKPTGGMATGASAYKLVLEQAEDEGLWFKAQYITEDYLQRALRELHAAVEADVAKPSLSPEMAHAMRNLLASMHGDGGHYVSEHGFEKACVDAQAKYYELLTRIDALEGKS